MNNKEVEKVIDDLLLRAKEIRSTKGLSYSGLEDMLGNFKRCAKLSGTTIEVAWFIYFIKHFDALSSYIRKQYTDSEPIRDRIIDLINYLFLFSAILEEQGELNGRQHKTTR